MMKIIHKSLPFLKKHTNANNNKQWKLFFIKDD